MKVWRLKAHGTVQGLHLEEGPVPVPDKHQVRIRCEGSGLNFADVMAVKGLYREAPPLPSVLGYEVVGSVDEVGPMAPRELLGKRVVAMTRFGGYAEYAVTDHRAVSVIPDTIPLGEAASFATQGCTAWYAARVLCPLSPGDRVLIHSAAGGVGHLLVQLALDTGCVVHAVASGQEKIEYLRGLGVQYVIDRSLGDYAEQLDQQLGSERLDVSFNAVGGSSYPKDMRILGSGGRIVLYGGAERGTIRPLGTLRFLWRMGLLLPIFLMMKSKSVLGLNMLRISENKPQVIASCLQAVVKAHQDGVLRPEVYRSYPAAALPEALAALEGGGTTGKVVIHW